MIFFDIDDTLTDSNGAHAGAIRALLIELGIDGNPTEAMLSPWFGLMGMYLDRYFRREITLEEQRSGRIIDFFRLYGISLSPDDALALYAEYHRRFLDGCLLFDDVLPALKRLSGHPLGIISNGVSADQYRKLANNGIVAYFDAILVSDTVGAAKPDAAIFQKAAAEASISVSACTYIGNLYETDYLGAKNAGMTSYWLNRTQQVQPGSEGGYSSLTAIAKRVLDP